MRIYRDSGWLELHRIRLMPRPFTLSLGVLLFLVMHPLSLWGTNIYVEHGLRLFEDEKFFSEWQDLNDEQRALRSDAIVAWLEWVHLFGTDMLVDAPDTPLASFDLLIPDASKPALAGTVDLDHMVALFNASGMGMVLEIRPNAGDLSPPASLTTFVTRVRSLVERYDGDLDFGIDTPFATDELPYPDINESWVVSSADFDGTSDEEKQAFADKHIVKAYSLCANLDLSNANLAEHSEWLEATAKAIAQANSEVKVFVGPFRLSQAKKGYLETLLGPLLESAPDALTGIFVDVDTPIDGSELGGGELETSFTNLRTVLKLVGGENLELVIGGNHIPSRNYEAGHSWVRPCPDGTTCNVDIQSQLLSKTLLRALSKGHSVGVAAPIGFEGNEDTPGPLATVATSWVDDEPVVNAAGMAWVRLSDEIRAEDRVVTEVAAPVQNVRMVRIGEDDSNQVLVAWYDWYRESAPGQPYSGIQKSITLDAPEGAVEALFTPLNHEVDSSIVMLPGLINHGEADRVFIDETRQFKVTLEDQLIVVRYSTEIPVADEDPGEIVETPDVLAEEDTVSPGSSSSGCNATPIRKIPWAGFFLLVLAASVVVRRHRNALG